MTPAAASRAIAKDAAPRAPGEPGLSIVIPLFNEAAGLPGRKSLPPPARSPAK